MRTVKRILTPLFLSAALASAYVMLIIKFNERDTINYRLARLVDGDSPKAFPYSIANFPICAKP